MKMNFSLISLMLTAMICTGCGLSGEQIVQPKANDVLQALRQQDESVVQIQLKQCQRSNVYEGQERAHPYFDLYRCTLRVERYDLLLNQSFIKDEIYILNLTTSNGWTIGSG
ncbi:hypothetical protein GPS47_12210 [Acinetobacter haemolyticus]|uniref:hypothetical protein n=1 Tax=Acinetobacter haemolyticus TaxID=29430 RepID=UPI000F67DE3B|nr:hypothetical protein [Acinetobacter haemolyticus]NAS06343.1 hypothetical protein [Acinetobacter haemolyticus]QHI30250.1 hypothetical protein AhaeINNSZ174_12640 [Acinetobacter haemolyticus]RSC82437.1 hypothetical protein EGT42_14320 [Acinetobacter haemolyticus]